MFGTRSLNALIGQGDYIILGLIASHSAVGVYYFAFRLAAQPVWILAGNVSNVIYPTLVKLRAEPRKQMEAALNACVALSYIMLGIAFLQALLAPDLLDLCFQGRWLQAGPLVQVLSIGLGLDAVSWVSGGLFSARGDFRSPFLLVLSFTLIFVALVLYGPLRQAALGTAIAVATYYICTQPFFAWFAFKGLPDRPKALSRMYILPTLVGIFAFGLSTVLEHISRPISSSLPLRIVSRATIFGVTYLFVSGVIERRILAEMSERVGLLKFARIRSRASDAAVP